MNRTVRIILGAALSIFFLWLAFRNVNRAAFLEALRNIKPKWVAIALIVYLSGHVVRSFRWQLLLSPLAPVKVAAVFPILMFGFLSNNLLPGRLGELARSAVAARRFSIPTASVLGTVAMERLGDLVGLLTIMMAAISVFPPARKALPSVLVSFLGIGVAIVIGFFLLEKFKGRFDPTSLVARVLRQIEHVFEGLKSIRSPRILIGVALLSIVVWWIEATVVLLVGRAFGLIFSPAQSAATITGISLGVVIPASPGYVGTYEFFGKEALRILGFPSDLSLVFVGFLHIFTMVVCSLLGLPVLFEVGSLRPQEQRDGR